MLNSKITLVILLTIAATHSRSQDYSAYYHLINEAEENFVLNRDSSCYAKYDQAFEDFEPFLKDPYIAAQIALYLGDTTRFYHYLSVCFQNGMPITALKTSRLIANSKIDSKYVTEIFDSTYLAKAVDLQTIDEICLKCYQSDSIKMVMNRDDTLIRLYHKSEDQTRQYLHDNYLVYGKFPNERLIGITSDKMLQEFHSDKNHPDIYLIQTGAPGYRNEEYELRAKCPFNIVLHSKCFYRANRELFLEAMNNGYIHPKEIGILEETSIRWHQNNDNPTEKCDDLNPKVCYNIYGNDPMNPGRNTFTNTPEGLLVVEANRKEIYMQKYSVDVQKKQLENELGIKFFFDFKDR